MKPLALTTRFKYTLQLTNVYLAERLELYDLLFHHDCDVLLPGPVVSPDARSDSGLMVLGACFIHAQENPTKSILIAGHTDTSGSDSYNIKLSWRRARNVNHLLKLEKDAWVKSCHDDNKSIDWHHVLRWLSTQGWDCDPGEHECDPEKARPIEPQHPAVKGAVERFQKSYNAKFQASIAEDGKVGKQTWGAFFDVYVDTLGAMLKPDADSTAKRRSEMDRRKGDLKFFAGGKEFVGCGESFPREAVGVDNLRSQTNRRVEVLFFEEKARDHIKLDCHPGTDQCKKDKCLVYKSPPVKIVPLPIRLGPAAKIVIKKIDKQFAPGAETLDVSYEIAGLAGQEVKIEVGSPDYPNNPIFTGDLSEDQKKDGTHTLRWDGKGNAKDGPLKGGRSVSPLYAPYTFTLISKAGAMAQANFNVLYHSIELGWAPHTPDEATPPEGERVKFAQAILNLHGYDPGPVNGTDGPVFKNAVRRFQRSHYKPGTTTLLQVTGAVDDDTLQALKNLTLPAVPRFETGKDPLQSDCKFYLDDNFYPSRGDDFVTSSLAEFGTSEGSGFANNRKKWAEDRMERPYLALEVTIKLQNKAGNGVVAPQGVGAAPVAWEVSDATEDASVIPAATNATARTYVERARRFGGTAAVGGAARIDADGDNARDTFDGIRRASPADTIKSWFPNDAGSKLEPYKIEKYGKETRGGKEFHHALVRAFDDPSLHPKRLGKAGAYFRHSKIGGEDAQLRVSIQFEGEKNKDRLTAAHKDVANQLVAQSGRWTVWRRMRVSAYCQQAGPTRNPVNPDWGWIRDRWQEAFIEVENNGQPLQNLNYGTVVTAAQYRAAILGMPASHRPAGVSAAAPPVYRPTCIYGGPTLTQRPGAPPAGETAAQFVARVRAAAAAWSSFPTNHALNAVLALIHAKARETSPEGLVIFDYRSHDPVSGQDWDPALNGGAGGFKATANPAAQNVVSGQVGYVRVDGAVTMNVDNDFNVSCYVLHECGHAKFLYHHHTGGGGAGTTSDNPKHHDADQLRCAMSYGILPDTPLQWLYPFCGKCLLRLRGWQVTKLPNRYTP